MSWGVAVLAAALPSYLIRFSIAGIPTTALELMIYGLFFLAILAPAARVQLWERRRWLVPPLLLIGGAAIGVAISPELRAALGLFKGFILDPILVYLLALMVLRTDRDRNRILAGLVAGGLGIALWAAAQFSGGSELRALGPYSLDAAASANYLAFAVAPLVPLVLVVIRPFWPRLLALGILVAALVLTGSRAGVGAGIGGLGIALLLQSATFWRSAGIRRLALVLLTLALVGSWFVVRPDFSRAPERGARTTSSNNVRWQIWETTSELVRPAPVSILGLGLGNYQRAFGELTAGRVNYDEFITPNARTPHNLLVMFWLEAGLLGLMSLVVVVVLVGRSLVRALATAATRPLAAALTGAWFAILAHGLVDTPVWKNDLFVAYWLLAAISLTVTASRRAA